MFLVVNKQKLFSYIIAFTTVVALLGMAKVYKNKSAEIVETFSKAKEENNQQINNLENNDAIKNKNSIIISEKWSDGDINQLVLLLKKYNVDMKFFVYKDWKSKHNASINQIANNGYEILELNNTNE